MRLKCVKRDGSCRYNDGWAFLAPGDPMPMHEVKESDRCSGPAAWAHMHQKRRSKTMGMPPEVRHTTKESLMLCARHHDQYDNKVKPRLYITALTRRGADGPLKFRRAK